MNIGVFIRDISPNEGGGFTFQETVVETLASRPTQYNLTIFHYGPQKNNSSKIRYLSLGKRVGLLNHLLYDVILRPLQPLSLKLRRGFKFNFPYPYGSKLDKYVRKNNIDLILFPAPDFEAVDVPYISTVWDLEHRAQPYFPEVSRKGEWRRRQKFFEKFLPRASFVITGTEVGKTEIVRFFDVAPERIRLLPHPTPAFALESYRKIKTKCDSVSEPFILYPAQFWSHKNHFNLLLGLKILKDKGILIELALVGSDKGNLAYIKSLVSELKLQDQVKCLGFVNREELVSLYQNALALVYASLCGPENLPPLEAFALGCPVIAADIPGSREQLGENALLVNPQAPDEIAQAIEKFLNSQSVRNTYIERGRLRATQFTHENFVSGLLEIFDEFQKLRKLWA